MATEKRRVNLVNLKTKFGFFLNKYYACQSCYSIDKLALGFNCEHKFCVDCNDGQLEYCKECKVEIENYTQDGLQNGLMPHFEDLKSIMGIDLKKVAAKQKQLQEQNQESDKRQVEPASRSLRKTNKSTKANSTTKSKPLVIIATSITENELKKLDKFAKKFNAKIVNEFSDEVTHLVTLEHKPNLTTRTLKYLKSLLTHKWLLSFNWVQDSLKNDKLVDEDDYELLGITKQIEANLGAPKRSRENQTYLFQNKRFCLEGKFKSGLSKKDYEDLVVIGGGEIVDTDNVEDDVFVVIEPGFKSSFKGRKNAFSTVELLNYVSNFEFDL